MAKQYKREDVKKHNDNQSSWIVIHNNIYDVTAFLNEVGKYLRLGMVQFSNLVLQIEFDLCHNF